MSQCYTLLSASSQPRLWISPYFRQGTSIILSSTFCLLILSLAKGILGAPVRTDTPSCFVDPECGPIPGDSPLYSDDISRSRPFPADMTAAVLPTSSGPAGEDEFSSRTS